MSDPFDRSVESEEVNSLLQNLIQSSFSHAPFSPHAPHIGPGATSEAFGFADPPHVLIPDARPYEFDDFDSDFKNLLLHSHSSFSPHAPHIGLGAMSAGFGLATDPDHEFMPDARAYDFDEFDSNFKNLLLHSHASFSPHAPHIGLGAMSVGFGFATDPDHEFMPDARAYDFDEFDSDFKGAEVSEGPSDSAPRRSSKRARAAEVHNMSEKRRRSRINEKMKALQKLIPNSNKTDKASMLDEAIEYLKQLQLQVQMLSMRNGVSLYPYCSPVPEPGISAVGQEPLITSNNDTPHHYPQSNQPNLFFPITGVADSKASFGLETPIGQHFQTLNHLASSKDICQVSQLHLEMKCSGKNSSSGVSS